MLSHIGNYGKHVIRAHTIRTTIPVISIGIQKMSDLCSMPYTETKTQKSNKTKKYVQSYVKPYTKKYSNKFKPGTRIFHSISHKKPLYSTFRLFSSAPQLLNQDTFETFNHTKPVINTMDKVIEMRSNDLNPEKLMVHLAEVQEILGSSFEYPKASSRVDT